MLVRAKMPSGGGVRRGASSLIYIVWLIVCDFLHLLSYIIYFLIDFEDFRLVKPFLFIARY